MSKSRNGKRPRIGKQPPRYTFFLNPYEDARFTGQCLQCKSKMGQKKLPLVIIIEEGGPVSLNMTCRFCSCCELLIAHKDEIENILVQLFEQLNPDVIGNDYLVIGTLDRAAVKRAMSDDLMLQDLREVLHDFKKVVDFEITGGWTKNA